MSKVRNALAGLMFAASLTAGIVGSAGEAAATVASSSGARADTTLVCQRLWGSYALHTANQGFQWARQYLYNTHTGAGSWGGWVSPNQLETGFALPTRGAVQVFVQYAYHNGNGWEITGEWGKVYNARGAFVSYSC